MPATLGERVRQARHALGLTQRDLAGPDLHKSFICLVEHNSTRPSPATLERLAHRLEKPLAYFLAGTGQPDLLQRVLGMLLGRGRSEVERGRYDAALATFSEMSQLAAACRDHTMEMYAVLGQGEALAGLWRSDDARPLLEDALGRARAAQDAPAECRALAALGRAEHRSGNFPRAGALYEEALAIVRTLAGAQVLHGDILHYRGTVLHRMGRLEESLESLTQAQRIFEDVRLPQKVGEVLVARGLVLYLSGDYDGALLHLERARALLEQYEDLAILSWARNNLGMVLLETGRPRDALEHFSASLTIKRRLKDTFGESHTLTELARCHFACGEMEGAREYAEQSIARSRNGGWPDEEPRAQIVLAAIEMTHGNARNARRYLLPAAEHCERKSMTLELVTVYREMARASSLLGRHKEASGYFDKAFSVLRRMAPRDAAAAIRAAHAGAGRMPAVRIGLLT